MARFRMGNERKLVLGRREEKTIWRAEGIVEARREECKDLGQGNISWQDCDNKHLGRRKREEENWLWNLEEEEERRGDKEEKREEKKE